MNFVDWKFWCGFFGHPKIGSLSVIDTANFQFSKLGKRAIALPAAITYKFLRLIR